MIFQAETLAEEWEMLTKKTFRSLLEDFISDPATDGAQKDVEYTNTLTNQHYERIDQKDKIRKPKDTDANQIMKLVKSALQAKLVDNALKEPKLTWFGVKMIDKNIVNNLAKHGNPFGGPNVQTRSSWKNKARNIEKNSPAWFR